MVAAGVAVSLASSIWYVEVCVLHKLKIAQFTKSRVMHSRCIGANGAGGCVCAHSIHRISGFGGFGNGSDGSETRAAREEEDVGVEIVGVRPAEKES